MSPFGTNNWGIVAVFLVLAFSQINSIDAARNKYHWPFLSNSIWNLPIGGDAKYKYTGFKAPANKGLQIDADVIIMTPHSPVTDIYFSSAAWTGKSRCVPDSGNKVLVSAPLPPSFIVPSDGNNYSTAILLADNNTIVQTQPLAKCTTGDLFTSHDTFPNEYLDQQGWYGAHGGSGFSAIGGTIRLGELVPGSQIRHALRINIDANKYSYNNPCYRWPAKDCDSYHDSVYKGSNPALKPGSLLALNKTLNIANLNLQTVPAKIIAWTLQNYGAYVADDTWYWDRFVLSAEFGPQGDVRDEFQKTFGYSTTQTTGPWAEDLDKIYTSLYVVDSWDANTYATVAASNGKLGAGGGSALQSWAPSI